jgi:hypothetical protein
MLAHRTDDGGKRDGSPGRAPISRKPSRGEGRLSPPVPMVYAPSRNLFCAQAPGARGHPAFPAPPLLEGDEAMQSSDARCAARIYWLARTRAMLPSKIKMLPSRSSHERDADRCALAPCGRGQLSCQTQMRSGEVCLRESTERNCMRKRTPHPSEFVSNCGTALSHKGRGHNNARRASLRRIRYQEVSALPIKPRGGSGTPAARTDARPARS